jgi:replicative DNA helicase
MINTPTHDHLPPFSQEAEEAVIGSVLISGPTVYQRIAGMLRAEHFYLVRNRHLWQTFERLASRNDIMDLTTISEDLRQRHLLDDIGGYAYLIHLVSNTPNSMHAEAYAKLVERTATRRRLLMAADEIREAAYDETLHIEQVMETAEEVIASVYGDHPQLAEPITMGEAIARQVEQFKAAFQMHRTNKDYVIGVRTGLADLDVMLDGLRPGITTLAGATGSGKSAFTLGIAQYAAQRGILRERESAAKTLFFSGEMTLLQLLNRLMSSRTGIPVRSIERGSVSADEVMTLNNACNALQDHTSLSFESSKRLNTTQIRQRVRSLVSWGELDLLVLDGLLQIDDLQIENSATKRKRQYAEAKRRDAIENIMNDLEDIGLTYNLPILLTHQISRAPSARQNKRPQLSDLAEASFVEQKSAVILFLYREAYYEPTCENPNAAEIIVAKNRHGETGTIDAYYDKQYTRFLDADRVRWTLGE